MIAVKIYWNIDIGGKKVDVEAVDWNTIDAPVSIYGPFETMSDAISWMENDYPEGDTEVYDMIADDFEIPRGWTVNHPDSIRPDIPDEDISMPYQGTPE